VITAVTMPFMLDVNFCADSGAFADCYIRAAVDAERGALVRAQARDLTRCNVSR
jgi:hypothetical protein